MPRPIGPWALNKLRLLELYLPGYLQASSRAIDRIYIDGFAGPGLNQVRTSGETVNGSPLLALNATARNNQARFTRLHFIERDAEVAAELRSTLKAHGGDTRAEVIEDDVNAALPQVVARYHPRAPIFVFLDTDRIEPAWQTIAAVADQQTELLINFPLGFALNRNERSEKVNAYFGTDDWRSASEGGSLGRTRRLLGFYKARLAGLGYTEQVDHDRLISASPGGADGVSTT